MPTWATDPDTGELSAHLDHPTEPALAVMPWRCEFRKGRGEHFGVVVRAGDRTVEVTISPKGGTVHVHVDGEKVGQ